MDGIESEEKVMISRSKLLSSFRCSDFGLRIFGLALTMAAIIVSVHNQSKVVPITVADGLPPLNIPVTAKWHYLSAFLYFVVANAIACSYATISLTGSLMNRRGKVDMGIVMMLLDLAMVAILFSGNGAAIAVGVIGYKGNSHVQWNKVCNVFDEFCHHMAAGVVVSCLGSLVFFMLVVLAALNLYKKSK